jgi:hypothetical protein
MTVEVRMGAVGRCRVVLEDPLPNSTTGQTPRLKVKTAAQVHDGRTG